MLSLACQLLSQVSKTLGTKVGPTSVPAFSTNGQTCNLSQTGLRLYHFSVILNPTVFYLVASLNLHILRPFQITETEYQLGLHLRTAFYL